MHGRCCAADRARVFTLLASSFAWLALVAAPPPASGQDANPTVTLSGHVMDAGGRGVAGAEILVAGVNGSVRSDSEGRYRISGISPGARTVTARRLGFAPATKTAVLLAGDRIVDLLLPVFPYRLAAVTVKAAQRPRRFDAHLDEFYKRRSRGAGGTFITREEIERLQARQMTDLFRLAPGFRATRDRRDGTRISSRGNVSNCRVRFYIDGLGVELIDNNLDLMVRVQDVEAVEFYRGVSTAPAEFSGLDFRGDAACGVIVVWTRRK